MGPDQMMGVLVKKKGKMDMETDMCRGKMV